jgi:hypothetical protein
MVTFSEVVLGFSGPTPDKSPCRTSAVPLLHFFRVTNDSFRIRRTVSARMLDVYSTKFPTTNRGSPSEGRTAERPDKLGWKCSAETQRNE